MSNHSYNPCNFEHSILIQRDDDLFLLLDADELPTPEVLLFLKLYDGYTEPIRFGFRWTVFGFFWLKAEDPGLVDNIPLIGILTH